MRVFQKIILLSMITVLAGCAKLDFSKEHHPYMPPHAEVKKNIKVAYVLGGGGVKGLAHLGVIEELKNAGIEPDLIVGCSSGAIVGAFYAEDKNIDFAKQHLLNTTRKDLLDPAFKSFPFSLATGNQLSMYMSGRLHARRFEDLKVPFVVVATNLQFGNLTEFNSGPLLPAVRASAAYPGAYFPVKIHKQYFVDGGVANPVPVQIAKKYHPGLIIAVDIGEQLTYNKPAHGLGVVSRSLEIAYIHQSQMAANDADIVIRFPFRDVGAFVDGRNEELYQEGRKAAQKALPEILKLAREKGIIAGEEKAIG